MEGSIYHFINHSTNLARGGGESAKAVTTNLKEIDLSLGVLNLADDGLNPFNAGYQLGG